MSAKEPMSITQNELLAALEEALGDNGPPDAMTVSDIMREKKLSRGAVKRRLTALDAVGRLETFRVRRPDSAGRSQVVEAYRLMPAKRKRAG